MCVCVFLVCCTENQKLELQSEKIRKRYCTIKDSDLVRIHIIYTRVSLADRNFLLDRQFCIVTGSWVSYWIDTR